MFLGQEKERGAPIFWEHEGNRAVRLGHWKLVAREKKDWELYDVESDRTEQKNLAEAQPDRVKAMAAMYDAWAKRCNVVPPEELPSARPTMPAKTKATANQSERRFGD